MVDNYAKQGLKGKSKREFPYLFCNIETHVYLMNKLSCLNRDWFR